MVASYDSLTFELLGHASLRIETDDGTIVYVDPWNDVIEGEPGDADVVFVTHDDFDHWDSDAVKAVAGPDVTVAVYEMIDACDLPVDVTNLPLEGRATIDEIDVRTVPAYNDPYGNHLDDDGTPFHADGEVIGLVLSLDETRVFYTSDTDFLEHHEDIEADVLVPPIGGHYTMNRSEAAEMARTLQSELVLPVHYGTFDPIETDVDAFVEECANVGIDVKVL